MTELQRSERVLDETKISWENKKNQHGKEN